MTNGWLLDTNIVSELFKGARADPSVRTWADQTPEDQMHLSVVTLGEIAKGIGLAEARGRDMEMQRQFLERELPDRFGDRIIPFDAEAAIVWGRLLLVLRGDRQDERRLAIDAQIAATAEVRSLGICSRNVRDFARLGIAGVLNPFERS